MQEAGVKKFRCPCGEVMTLVITTPPALHGLPFKRDRSKLDAEQDREYFKRKYGADAVKHWRINRH